MDGPPSIVQVLTGGSPLNRCWIQSSASVGSKSPVATADRHERRDDTAHIAGSLHRGVGPGHRDQLILVALQHQGRHAGL